MEFSIRIAEIADAPQITELSLQLGYDANTTAIQQRLHQILQNEDNCIFVGIKNGELIGWIHAFHSLRVESNSFVEIGGLVVSENFRKQGFGKQLVDEVINWTASKNCEKVRVRCNVIRKESHEFYESIGFELQKEQKIFDKKLG